jgi:biotin synthase
MRAARTAINRYSVVTSGKGLTPSEVKAVANALSALNGSGIQTCASLGILAEHDMQVLKAAGVGRYHHNLETSESYFRNMCTTHTYEERIRTLYAAKEAGLSVCSGGVFGIGESQEQILELALALRALEVDAVPLNFLVPIKGTRNEACKHLSPLKCLKIIALFRYAVPDKEIIICGGREANLKELHPLVFYAGASGIMTGDYLTTSGIALDRDMQMLDHLGLIPRAKRKDDRGQCITLTPNALTNKDRS